MDKYLVIILLLFTLGCKNEKPNKVENRNEIKLENNEVNYNREIAKIAKSFHNWYLRNTNYYPNDKSEKESTSFEIKRGENGNCEIDYSNYFNNLKRLGTISNKFLEEEKKRTLNCANFLRTIKWEDYNNSDGYDYEEYCGFLYYIYWTRSQENTEKIEVISMEKVFY